MPLTLPIVLIAAFYSTLIYSLPVELAVNLSPREVKSNLWQGSGNFDESRALRWSEPSAIEAKKPILYLFDRNSDMKSADPLGNHNTQSTRYSLIAYILLTPMLTVN